MPSMKKEKEEKIRSVIEYVYPGDLKELYATGVRLMVSSPFHVKFNFFWDKMQDEIAEETVVQVGDTIEHQVSKRATEQRLIKREFVASVTMPIPSFISLLKVMSEIDKDVIRRGGEKGQKTDAD